MNETNLLDPDFDRDDEPRPCSVPFCNDTGPRGICRGHMVHDLPEEDFDPNMDHGDDERRFQQGL
jgi:hypothetical protein